MRRWREGRTPTSKQSRATRVCLLFAASWRRRRLRLLLLRVHGCSVRPKLLAFGHNSYISSGQLLMSMSMLLLLLPLITCRSSRLSAHAGQARRDHTDGVWLFLINFGIISQFSSSSSSRPLATSTGWPSAAAVYLPGLWSIEDERRTRTRRRRKENHRLV